MEFCSATIEAAGSCQIDNFPDFFSVILFSLLFGLLIGTIIAIITY